MAATNGYGHLHLLHLTFRINAEALMMMAPVDKEQKSPEQKMVPAGMYTSLGWLEPGLLCSP